MSSPVPTRPSEAAEPRLAATILLVREHGDDDPTPEVLMLRRHAASGFAASAWVFPGGIVDPRDGAVPKERLAGLQSRLEAARLGTDEQTVRALHVAAVRETFEEAGVLLATHRDGSPVDSGTAAATAARAALNDRSGSFDFTSWLEQQDLILHLEHVTPWLNWVTPIQEPRRYDTVFFVATMPPGVTPRHDDVETTESRWVTARAALEAGDELPMIFPTIRTLEWLAQHASVAALRAHAAAIAAITPIQPHIFVDADGRYTGIALPDDPRYPHEVYGT